MEAAVKVALVRHGFRRAYDTDIFEDWRVGPSSKVRFETAFQAQTGRHGGGNYRWPTTALLPSQLMLEQTSRDIVFTF